MKPVKIFVAFLSMLIISTATYAQPGRTRVQQKRMEQGVRKGELSRHEIRHQRRIRHDRREIRRDRREIRHERRRAIHRRRHHHRI